MESAPSCARARQHDLDPSLGELPGNGDAERFRLVERTGEIRAHEPRAVERRGGGPHTDPPARRLSERSEWRVRVGV